MKEDPDQVSARETLRNFVTTTSIKGVSRAARATSFIWRALWIITVATGTGIVTYLLYLLLALYLSYTTVTKYSVCTDCAPPFPDVTVCNHQAVTTVEDAHLGNYREHANKVSAIEEVFRSYFGRRRDINHKMRLIPELYSTAGFYSNINRSALLEKLPQLINDSLIRDCQWYDWKLRTHDCSIHIIPLFKPEYFLCYTIRTPEDIGNIAALRTTLYRNDYNSETNRIFINHMLRSQSKGVRVLIHPRGTYPSVEARGFDVGPGVDALITLKATNIKRKGYPYSDCVQTKYLEEPSTTQGWPNVEFAYTELTARGLCQQNWILREAGCLSHAIEMTPKLYSDETIPMCLSLANFPNPSNISHNMDQINHTLEIMLNQEKALFDSTSKGMCEFAISCEEYEYKHDLSTSPWPHESYHLAFYQKFINASNARMKQRFAYFERFSQNRDRLVRELTQRDSLSQQFLQLTIKFESRSVTLLEDAVSVTLTTLIGTIGGTLNLWVGINIFSLVELLEFSFKFVRAFFSGERKLARLKIAPK